MAYRFYRTKDVPERFFETRTTQISRPIVLSGPNTRRTTLIPYTALWVRMTKPLPRTAVQDQRAINGIRQFHTYRQSIQSGSHQCQVRHR